MTEMFYKIKKDLPNFPDEVIKEWLEPLAVGRGWSPEESNWYAIMNYKSLDFWKKLLWQKKKVNISEIQLNEDSKLIIGSMYEAICKKKENNYSKVMGNKGKEKYLKITDYLNNNGGVWSKPIILLEDNGSYFIADGNHRYFAWIFNQNSYNFLEEGFLFSNKQEVWIATP